jgi:hypothetical protein
MLHLKTTDIVMELYLGERFYLWAFCHGCLHVCYFTTFLLTKPKVGKQSPEIPYPTQPKADPSMVAGGGGGAADPTTYLVRIETGKKTVNIPNINTKTYNYS